MILLSEVLCTNCEGQGLVEIMYQDCCGYVSDNGECCGMPMPVYDVDYCGCCNGMGLVE